MGPQQEGALTRSAHIASIDGASRRVVRSWLMLCVLALVPAACGETSDRSTTRSSTANQTSLTIRSCKTAVYGQLAHGWRSSPQAVRAGVVSFLYGRSYRDAPARQFRGTGSGMARRYPGQKLLVVIDSGAIATVVVALKERARVGLQYQPAVADPPYRITQGTSAVEFEACHTPTQFNGGFIVAGPRCVQLDVHHNGKLTRAWIPFGTGREPCPRRAHPA